ncbi:MAG: hypothetical protein ACRDT4_10565 [Micromonosporaceae bacterium]
MWRSPRSLVLPALATALALAILAPLLPRGFVLVYDMSFVPRQAFLPEGLGLGTGNPRAVPADALVSLATTVIPGDILQKLILAALLMAGALGAARLVPDESLLVRATAAVAYTWNGFMAERLLIGQWGLLVAYAALPWIVATARELRDDPSRRSWARLVLMSAPAVITATGGLLAAGAAIAVAGRRRLLGTTAVAVALNAPWWVPALFQGDGTSDPEAVAVFAARGESWAPPVLSVLGLGGIWNAQVVPASREGGLFPLFTLLMLGIAGYGIWRLIRAWGAPARALTALAGAGLLFAVAGSIPGLDTALGWAVTHIPGAGLLRDGQKWAAWWALLLALGYALGAAGLAAALRRRIRDDLGPAAIVVGALLLPIAVMPDLGWGAAGRLAPAAYPSDWQAVSALLARDERPGDVLAAPLSAYRRFSWNGDRTQYDPALRHLPRPTVIADALKVGPVMVRGEDTRAARVTAAALRGEPLGRHGIGWVLVEHGTPGPKIPLQNLTRVYDGEWLTLYRVPGPVAAGAGWPAALRTAAAPWVLTADLIAALLCLVSALALLLPCGKLTGPRPTGADKRKPGG